MFRFLPPIALTATLFASLSSAALVTPSSYTATPGEGTAQGGIYDYFDETGSQLTDGIIGANNWQTDLGNGVAYEWVGWTVANPSFTFNFAAPVDLTNIAIGFNRNSTNSIFLPGTVTIGGTVFNLTGTELASGTRGFLNFAVNLLSVTSLQITLADNDTGLRSYIFVDEFQFTGEPARVNEVPEPSSFGLAAAGLLLAASARKLRHRS